MTVKDLITISGNENETKLKPHSVGGKSANGRKFCMLFAGKSVCNAILDAYYFLIFGQVLSDRRT
jgi:hypothetical protein